MLVSISDLAKYPFTREAVNRVKGLDLKIDELVDSEYEEVLNRAEQRIEEALLDGVVKWRGEPYYEIEFLSYPVAIMLVAAIDDGFLRRRYALAEAKRAHNLLRREEAHGKLVEIAKSSFNWKGAELPSEADQPDDYSLSFIDYLRNASRLRDEKWKLVNRLMINGKVFLKKDEFARLIREEAQKQIYKTVKSSPKISLQSLMLQRIERINQILAERKEKIRMEELPKKTLAAAYPPCIKRLYDSLLAGRHLSHIGRFSLTSFLLNVGVSVEELVKVYTSVSDFDERLTRYQVEHIAGRKGSGTKYTPPSCGTLKTHGLCPGPDELCRTISHPLSYYRKKIRLIRRGGWVAKSE